MGNTMQHTTDRRPVNLLAFRILSLAQFYRENPEAALDIATQSGREHDEEVLKGKQPWASTNQRSITSRR